MVLKISNPDMLNLPTRIDGYDLSKSQTVLLVSQDSGTLWIGCVLWPRQPQHPFGISWGSS